MRLHRMNYNDLILDYTESINDMYIQDKESSVNEYENDELRYERYLYALELQQKAYDELMYPLYIFIWLYLICLVGISILSVVQLIYFAKKWNNTNDFILKKTLFLVQTFFIWVVNSLVVYSF